MYAPIGTMSRSGPIKGWRRVKVPKRTSSQVADPKVERAQCNPELRSALAKEMGGSYAYYIFQKAPFYGGHGIDRAASYTKFSCDGGSGPAFAHTLIVRKDEIVPLQSYKIKIVSFYGWGEGVGRNAVLDKGSLIHIDSILQGFGIICEL